LWARVVLGKKALLVGKYLWEREKEIFREGEEKAADEVQWGGEEGSCRMEEHEGEVCTTTQLPPQRAPRGKSPATIYVEKTTRECLGAAGILD